MNLRFYRAPLLAALTLLTSACREESAEPKEIVIGFSQCCSDVFREAMLFDMQIESANYPNVRLVVRNADYDNELQRQQVAELTRSADPVDVLIVSPNEAEPLTDVTVDAYLRGIPTIILDRMINSDQYSVAIGADNYQIGRTAGRYIRQHLPPGSRILEIWGIPGSTPAVERHNGLLSTLGDSYRVDSVHGEWQPNIAAERIARLESYDDIDCIFAHNDVMALAAREAIMRRDSISGRRIRYLGIDATYGVGLEAIVDGRLDASFLYPTGGATAIRKAVELLQGVPVEKNVRLNTATIDRSNAQTLIAQAQQMEDYQRRINRQREELNALSVRFDYLQNSSLAIFCLTALLIPILIYALYANRKIRQKNRELHETNAQIEFQRRELTLKNAQLERASTSKLRFFTNISHEIRTPVSLIINPLQQITRQGNILPAPVYETLKLIIRNADRLLKMVNRILDVSRMEDQSEVLILTEIRIADFLRDVGRCFEPLAQTRKIRFTLQDHSGNAPLTIDADKIELIFMNLLSNAFRFTPDGGEITVRSTCDRDWVTIEVEDSGCGIPPERLPHIFKRFFTDDRNPGTGVGLHLCREITELHHGEISAENRPEGGTRMRLRLQRGTAYLADRTVIKESPSALREAKGRSDGSLVSAKLQQRRSEKLLIVEDNADIREYLRRELGKSFPIETATNGAEALRLLRLDPKVSLVVSDVMMPDMDGLEMTREIRNDQRLSHLPVILLTALCGERNQLQGMAQGADAYIQKPFNIDLLHMQIVTLLDDRERMRRSLGSRIQEGNYLPPSEVAQIVGFDEQFRTRLLELLEKRAADSSFSTTDLSRELNLSRVHLYRKTKELFGTAPSELIRNFRLNKALARWSSGNGPSAKSPTAPDSPRPPTSASVSRPSTAKLLPNIPGNRTVPFPRSKRPFPNGRAFDFVSVARLATHVTR